MAEPLVAALTPELQAELDRLEQKRLDSFGEETLLWLALVPEWTERLAESVGLPTGEDSVPDFVARAQRAGLCESTPAPDNAGSMQLHFWMPGSARATVLRRNESPERRKHLRETVKRLADQFERVASAPDSDVSSTVVTWTEVARAAVSGHEGSSEGLNQRIQGLVDDGKTGEALEVIDVAESLVPLVGGELDSVLVRGKRRVSLEYRRRHDVRQLETFLRRSDQIEAFAQLLDGPDDEWALHFVGMGGVGKTMLIRYLSTAFAEEHNKPPLTVARIDFDHVSPLYPGERPGQLLLVLADELAAHASSRLHTHSLGTVLERLTTLHELAASDDVAIDLDSPAFIDAVDAFAKFVRELPSPVLLILDTCEELAKLHPAGEEAPSITMTFGMLERLQLRVPDIRVVFAGRRLLASEGRGWSLEDAAGPLSPVSYQARPYLALHEIRGFTREEATEYFVDLRHQDPSTALIDAILRNSLETGRVAGVPGGTSSGGEEERYNPYDLALYADWPDLDAETVLSADTDPYVELRIVSRLENDPELRSALPTVVLLGRLDAEMLGAALGGPRPGLFERLADQEWIDASTDSELGVIFLEVEPTLRGRIVRYFERAAANELRAARDAAGGGLRELVERKSLRDLVVEHLEVPLRILPPADAAALWERVARSICDEGAWAWAHSVCLRLLAYEGPAGPPDSPIRAGVHASLIGAKLHGKDASSVDASNWADVGAATTTYGDADSAAVLRDRAFLGRLTATVRTGNAAGQADAVNLERCLAQPSPSTDAAMAGLLDVLLDEPHLDPEVGHVLAEWIIPWSNRVSTEAEPALAAFASMLCARALARDGQLILRRVVDESVDFADAAKTFTVAESAAPSGPVRQVWNDWVAPDVRARVRLEAMRLERALGSMPAEGERWLEDAIADLRGIDAERLASSIVAGMLERRVVDPDLLERLEKGTTYRHDRQPRCLIHRRTPPLYVTVAEGWLALGDGERAKLLLQAQEVAASESRADPATVDTALVAELELARRLRLEGFASSLIVRFTSSPMDTESSASPRLRHAACAAGALIYGLSPGPPPDDTGEIGDWWRTTSALGADEALAALDGIKWLHFGPDGTALHLAHRHLDRCEAGYIARRVKTADEQFFSFPDLDWQAKYEWEGSQPFAVDGMSGLAEIALAGRSDEARGVGTDPPGSWATLLLRTHALARPQDLTPISGLEPIPSRWLGLLALREGELLALRVPEAGANLLLRASRLFEAAGDEVAAGISLVRAGIAQIHAGADDAARTLLKTQAVPHYRRLEQGALAGEAWQGWQKRIEVCEEWLLEGPAAAEVDAGAPVSAELRLRSAAVVKRPGMLRRAVPGVFRWLWAMGGLAVAVGFLVGIAFAIQAIANLVVPSASLGFWSALGLGVFVLVLLFWTGRAAQRLRTQVIERNLRLAVTITPPPAPAPGRARVRVGAVIPSRAASPFRRAVLLLFVSPRLFETFHKTVEDEVAVEATGQSPPKLPPALAEPLAALMRRARGAQIRVGLEVPPALAGFCWERTVADTVPSRLGGDLRLPFVFVRTSRPLQVDTQVHATPDAAIGILASSAWAHTIERAWDTPSVELLDPAGSGRRTVRVLHIVGTPTFGYASGGWSLRLSSQDASMEVEQALRSEGEAQEQLLVGADRLPATPLALVVTQDEPVDVAGDRLSADGLRSFAADVATTVGTPVLSLPALSPAIASEVVRTLASRSAGWLGPPDTPELIQLVADLQSLIQQAASIIDRADRDPWTAPLDPDEAANLALEVTLFVPEEADSGFLSQKIAALRS